MGNRWWVLLVFCVPLIGCTGKQTQVTETTSAEDHPAAVLAPVTAEEAHRFGEKLEAAILVGDIDRVERLFRMESIIANNIDDLGITPANRATVLSGARGFGRNFAKKIASGVSQGGNYTFLRVRMVDDRPHVLMRLILPDQGATYHDFTLARYSDGGIASADLYLMATGETLTQMVRRLIVQLSAKQDGPARLNNADRLYMKNEFRLRAMTDAFNAGRQRDVLDTYRELPEELQRERLFLLLAIRAASEVDDKEFERLAGTFRRDYPGEVVVDLYAVAHYERLRKYDDAIRSLDRVDNAVGGDPYQWWTRANIQIDAGRLAEAKADTEKAMEKDPKLVGAYWTRISVAILEMDYDGALAWMKKIIERFNLPLGDEEIRQLRALPHYKDFLESEEFEELLSWYKDRKK